MPPLPRSFRRAVFATALLVATSLMLTASSALAGKTRSTTTGSLSWSTGSVELQNPVEQWTPGWLMACPSTDPSCRDDQSTWVLNKTGCTWDVDDHWDRSANYNSSLAAGATVTDDLCDVADCDGGQCGPYRYVALSLYSASPDLRISLAFDPGQTYVATSAYDPAVRLWHYSVCAQPPVYPYGDPRLQDIPGSNGGKGVPTTVSVSVTNAGSRSASKISGGWGIYHANQGVHC